MTRNLPFAFAALAALSVSFAARGGYDDAGFVVEARDGLASSDFKGKADLSDIVYGTAAVKKKCGNSTAADDCVAAAESEKYTPFIPTTMHIRMGGGMGLGFGTGNAEYGGGGPAKLSAELDRSWGAQFGLGWNLLSFVWSEIDVQVHSLSFGNPPWAAYELTGRSQSVAGLLYFDLVKRYERYGDITKRRIFVPFIGAGLAVGSVDFDDAAIRAIGFASGSRHGYAAPRLAAGVSIALNNMTNLDVVYQYEMMLTRGFGWESREFTATGFTSLMASLRFNF